MEINWLVHPSSDWGASFAKKYPKTLRNKAFIGWFIYFNILDVLEDFNYISSLSVEGIGKDQGKREQEYQNSECGLNSSCPT